MERDEKVVKVIEMYKGWGQWLTTIDVAAIAAIGFIVQQIDSPEVSVLLMAYLCLLLFGASVVFSTILVGNLTSIQTHFLTETELPVTAIAPHQINPHLRFSVATASAAAAIFFTAGAAVFAVLMGLALTA